MTVQQIYYPGFTAGGFSEVAALVTLVVLLFLQPYGTAQFWWSAAALALLAAVHAIYWISTHPVNNFWLKDVKLSGFGNSFFSRFAGTGREDEWKRLRDVWEYSHGSGDPCDPQPGRNHGLAECLIALKSPRSI